MTSRQLNLSTKLKRNDYEPQDIKDSKNLNAPSKGNVPALRFPEFTEEWIFAPLYDYLEENKERNRNDEFDKGDVLSVSGDYGIVNQIQLLGRSFAGSSVRDYHIVRKGNIVYTKSPLKKYPYGIVKVNKGNEGIVSTLYAVYCVKQNAIGDFIESYFALPKRTNRYFKPIVRIDAKHDMKIGNEEAIANIVCFPSYAEQRKISAFISLLNERISIQSRIIEKYKSLIKAMCDTLIERETQQVTLSFSDFGQSYSGLSGKSAEDFGDGYPFITYMNVYQNQIIDSTDIGLVKIKAREQQSVVRHGDILLTLSSETPEEVGMGAVYFGKTYPLYLNSFCFGIHITDESMIYPPFLAYYVSSQLFRKAVYPLAQGSTRFNLQKSDFMKKKFSFPLIEKQRQIYSILNAYSNKLIVEKQIMRLLCNQKCHLLRQLFI